MRTGAFSPQWLAAREVADAAARAHTLLAPLAAHLTQRRTPLEIHDIGAGTGSMRRWLARRLPGPQTWILHDSDPHLLDRAARDAATTPFAAADDSPITTETRRGDLTELGPDDFAGADLVTGSAVLDLLTRDEVTRLADACVRANCAVLWTLSVTGRVEISPPHPLDSALAAAFDAHQRRTVDGRALLGPDAPLVAADAFLRHDFGVFRHPSPWRLGPDDDILTADWLRGWVGAATEHCPDLTGPSCSYLDQRIQSIRDRTLRVVVNHEDLLALPTAPG